MYLDQKIRINSPLVDSELKRVSDELSTILGDSSLLFNIALLYSQGVMYTTEDHIQLTAVSFADSVSNDMLYHYSTLTGLTGDELRLMVAKQVFAFITESARFFKSSPSMAPLFAELRRRNLYISNDRVSDDVIPPYIDVKICRG